MPLEIHQFACLRDNYGYLVHDAQSGQTVCIDTPDGEECLRQAQARGWRITQVWNTHWHPDHAGGNATVKAATGCTILGPAEISGRFPIDRVVRHGDRLPLGTALAEVIDVAGHTNGHVAYHLPAARAAFVGDSVFALGCGRMFEGEAEQFWASLQRIRALPPDTRLYCAHEYTEANARFALHADPDNPALRAYARSIAELRQAGAATVPTVLAVEAQTNPFLRADDPTIQVRWGGATPAQTFAALRAAKDRF